MITLGINSAYHESSAALVVDGRVVAAAEEERFNRVKHGKPARVDNAHQPPSAAIAFCLESTGVSAAQLDAVAYSFDPRLRQRTFQADPLSKPGDWGTPAGEEVFQASLARVPAELSKLLDRDVSSCLQWVPHHMAHAASAYYPSGFDEAAVLVVDGIGEQATTLLAVGRKGRIDHLRHLDHPHSLGFLWEKLSKYLGFSEYDACKVMGLAGYGNPSEFAERFGAFVTVEGGGFRLRPEVLEFRLDTFEALERVLGPRRDARGPLTQAHKDIAAALQEQTNNALLALVEELYRLAPVDALCLAGGVALNCTSNWLVKEKGPFKEVYIPSAPHDAGTAVGAALLVHHQRGGVTQGPVMPTPYMGPRYSDEDIARLFAAEGVHATRSEDIAADVAALIAKGCIVGWFQGAMEFGPRALGNRSLLADPRSPEIRELMNVKVKHRETFRPFAPSVLAERSAEWFELGRPSASLGAMLFACPVRPGQQARIPAVLHIDGTARVQVVRREENSLYHDLISHFERLTGVPIVLNTSFNDSEPIVCSPRDALATFRSTRIDALAMGSYLLMRPRETGREPL